MRFVIHYAVLTKPFVKSFEDTEKAVAFSTALGDQSSFIVDSEAELAQVPSAALVAIFNQVGDGLGAKPIKKFENRATANRRVWPMLATVAIRADEMVKAPAAVEQSAAEASAAIAADAAAPEVHVDGAKKKRGRPAVAKSQTRSDVSRAPNRSYNFKKTGTPTEPKEKTKAAVVLAMLRKGTTYDKIQSKFDFNAQGVYDVLWYLRVKCGFGLKTNEDGLITVLE